jgi:HSP20 family molecular chaperone IbpA
MLQKRFEDPFKLFDSMFDGSRLFPVKEMPKKEFPAIDIKVNKETKETIVELFIAGYKKEDINIELKEGKIIISGESKKEEVSEDYVYFLKQSSSKSFKRVLTLLEEVENISAEMDDGVLRLKIVSKQPKKPEITKIEIK